MRLFPNLKKYYLVPINEVITRVILLGLGFSEASLPSACSSRRKMYPRVKVREDATYNHEVKHVSRKSPSPRSPLLGLKALELLSIHDHHSSEAKSQGHVEEQHRVVFAECIARIPNSSVSNGATRTNTINKGKDTISNEDNKAQIRASSVPRPRAVLSSSDNDAMIGKRNRKATVQSSALRNHDRLQTKSAHLQFTVPVENINIDARLKCTVPVETIGVNGRGCTGKPKASFDTNKHNRGEESLPSSKAMNYRTSLRAGKLNAARF